MRVMVKRIQIKQRLLLGGLSLMAALVLTGGRSFEIRTDRLYSLKMMPEDSLREHFLQPSRAYTILPFWSWNNTLRKDRLNWQMDQMMGKGIYGAFMHARAGIDSSETPYFSEGWWDAVESTVKHAGENGFYAGLYDEDKWPSGSAGGRVIARNPGEFIKKAMHYTSFEVIGPQTVRLELMDRPYALFAGKTDERGRYDSRTQKDLTAFAGQEWGVPPGRWVITAFKIVKDPHEQIDYLDTAAVAAFLHVTHDEYYKRLAPYFGNTIPGVFFDEIYASFSDRFHNLFWTDDFDTAFLSQKSYDLRNKLPLLVLEDPDSSAGVRYDYFDVVRDLYARAWFKQYAGWGDDHHIWVTGHTTELMSQFNRQSDYFYTMGQLQVPGTDIEDFRYSYPRHIDFYSPKQISSIGHMYGKKRIMAETMGGGGYTIPLEEYRYGSAMLGVYGINMFVPHLFHYSQELPVNQADWPPSWFYRNPYWKYFKPLAQFMQRLSYMNSQGHHVCDVAVLYPLTDLWLASFGATPDPEFYTAVQRLLLEEHIDYDVIDPYSLSKAGTDSLGLKIAGEHYRFLILPSLTAVSRGDLEKITEFVANGGVLISVAGMPVESDVKSPVDPEVRKAMNDIFGFDYKDLSSRDYHTWGKEKIHRYTVDKKESGGIGIFTWYPEELPQSSGALPRQTFSFRGTTANGSGTIIAGWATGKSTFL